MPAPRNSPEEFRGRAKRMVAGPGSRTRRCQGAVCRIARGWGCSRTRCGPGAVRPRWKRVSVPVTSVEAVKIREVEREVRELRRANESLLAASSSSLGSWTRDILCSGVHRRPRQVRVDPPDVNHAQIPAVQAARPASADAGTN